MKVDKIIYAAGGVVRNNAGNILLIYRHDKWDLPKGKQEELEDLISCALREVCEECGLTSKSLVLDGFICETVHYYEEYSVSIEKRTSWYRMSYTSTTTSLTPQLEEGITSASWFSLNEARELIFNNSYDSIKEVIVKF